MKYRTLVKACQVIVTMTFYPVLDSLRLLSDVMPEILLDFSTKYGDNESTRLQLSPPLICAWFLFSLIAVALLFFSLLNREAYKNTGRTRIQIKSAVNSKDMFMVISNSEKMHGCIWIETQTTRTSFDKLK